MIVHSIILPDSKTSMTLPGKPLLSTVAQYVVPHWKAYRMGKRFLAKVKLRFSAPSAGIAETAKH